MGLLIQEKSMQRKPPYLFLDPWSDPPNKFERKDNLYICLGGTSGVGKSRLTNILGKRIFKHDDRAIAID